MTAEICEAHHSKGESSENVFLQPKGDLKRRPKISKTAGEIFENFGSPLEVTFWLQKNVLWTHSFRMVCYTSLCGHYFGRYRRSKFSKWPKIARKTHVKIAIFSASSNISANCWPILMIVFFNNYPKTPVSGLVPNMSVALQLFKLFKFESVKSSLAHPVQCSQ